MFAKLPTVKYPYDKGIELAGIVLANLPSRLAIDTSYIMERKFVSDGETAEAVAFRVYKRPDLHWVLLYINAIRDPYTEWPMREGILKTYADLKYGIDSQSQIHHLVDTRTQEELDPEDYSIPYPFHITPVSYLMHEQNLNNARREIVAIAPKYIHDFVDLYNELIQGKVVA